MKIPDSFPPEFINLIRAEIETSGSEAYVDAAAFGAALNEIEKLRAELEAQEGIIAILEFFRDDAKSVAEEAMTLLKEIAFHGVTPERRQRVVDDLRKIVSREEE